MEIAIVVQGLFEKSDSIGFDAIFQYRELRNKYGAASVAIFAETYDKSLYPDVPIKPYSDLGSHCQKTNATVIYHYCDGWEDFDKFLMEYQGRAILRWHNNTPPWFFANNSNSLNRTVRGFENIVSFAARKDMEFWVNSEFTKRQMVVMGFDDERVSVVYPASRYLRPQEGSPEAAPVFRDAAAPLRLLFVGRVVEHKGHAHIISCARVLKEAAGYDVVVDFAGRANPSAHEFNEFLGTFADASGLEVNFHGEVTEEKLLSLYRDADVFVCLSEHEGFGLPVFEAMRCMVPVVAWRSTAFRDLLAEHPCCVDEFDIAGFAASIEMLRDRDIAEEVLKIQGHLLGKYTIDIVRDQMFSPLENVEASWTNSVSIAPVSADMAQRHEALRNRYVQYLRENGEFLREIPHEHNINYVTLYDIKAYRTLLSNGDQLTFRGGGEADTTFGKARLPVSEFSFHDINPVPGGYMMFGPGIGHHETLVFGPYRMFNAGFYRVGMGLKYVGADEDFASIGIIVETTDGDKIAEKDVILSHLHHSAFVDFHMPEELSDKKVEFKVKTREKIRGVMFFNGADIIKMPAPFDDMFSNIDLDSILGMAAFDYSAVIESSDRRRSYEREILLRETKVEWLTAVLQTVLHPPLSVGTRIASIVDAKKIHKATLDALRKSGLFDSEEYYALNFDVAQSGQDALIHYIKYGIAERRPIKSAWKGLAASEE